MDSSSFSPPPSTALALSQEKLEVLAYVEGCYPEKFGIPRQPHLAPHGEATLHFNKPYHHPNFFRGLEAYSHLWLIFGFHHARWRGQALVRPPRLGGNKKLGVFASRSPFTPNNLGLSSVKLEKIDKKQGRLLISGHDLVNGTPIYSIKPYLSYSDCLPQATSTLVEGPPIVKPVAFLEDVLNFLEQKREHYPHLKKLIEEVVAQDPTPAYHQDSERIYGLRLYAFNIRFRQEPQGFMVIAIDEYKD